jgi:hypothetical protein
MNADPALFIGAMKTSVKERVMDQSAFCVSHINQENISKKLKRPCGPKTKSGPGSTNKQASAKLKSREDYWTTEG